VQSSGEGALFCHWRLARNHQVLVKIRRFTVDPGRWILCSILVLVLISLMVVMDLAQYKTAITSGTVQ
jgi:hypothetical protein